MYHNMKCIAAIIVILIMYIYILNIVSHYLLYYNNMCYTIIYFYVYVFLLCSMGINYHNIFHCLVNSMWIITVCNIYIQISDYSTKFLKN